MAWLPGLRRRLPGSAPLPVGCGALLALLVLGGCGAPVQKHSTLAMTSPLNILVAGRAAPDWEALKAYTDREASLFDWRVPDSPVGRLNRGEAVAPPPEVAPTLAKALEVASATKGAFDPTVLPLVQLWDFDHGGHLPPPVDIQEARRRVNWRQVSQDAEGRCHLPAGFGLDLGGIAQGAVVDLLGAWLERRGFRRYLVEASGDILIAGQKGRDQPWTVAIRHPRRGQEFVGILKLGEPGRKVAVVTSGDYERFFELGGRRYHHILDPATGYPATGLVSVTVIAPTCTEADALSTAAFVLGPARGLELLESLPGVEGLLIAEKDGKLQAELTSGFPLRASDLHL
jgi:thiamine biosynthesis lipoprotein